MKHIRRWAFHLLSALSLLLFLAFATLWVRSYWVFDTFYRVHMPRGFDGSSMEHIDTISSVGGQLRYWRLRSGLLPEGAVPTYYHIGMPAEGDRLTSPRPPRGFSYLRRPTGFTLTAPHWPFALLTALAPALWLAATLRRRRRRQSGRCASCGYDLRATPERCPECGAAAQNR